MLKDMLPGYQKLNIKNSHSIPMFYHAKLEIDMYSHIFFEEQNKRAEK